LRLCGAGQRCIASVAATRQRASSWTFGSRRRRDARRSPPVSTERGSPERLVPPCQRRARAVCMGVHAKAPSGAIRRRAWEVKSQIVWGCDGLGCSSGAIRNPVLYPPEVRGRSEIGRGLSSLRDASQGRGALERNVLDHDGPSHGSVPRPRRRDAAYPPCPRAARLVSRGPTRFAAAGGQRSRRRKRGSRECTYRWGSRPNG